MNYSIFFALVHCSQRDVRSKKMTKENNTDTSNLFTRQVSYCLYHFDVKMLMNCQNRFTTSESKKKESPLYFFL